MSDPFRLEFDPDGTLRMRGRDGWQEATCAVCEQPIQWCLDMFTFTTGYNHGLAHARCVWTFDAFTDSHHRPFTLESNQ